MYIDLTLDRDFSGKFFGHAYACEPSGSADSTFLPKRISGERILDFSDGGYASIRSVRHSPLQCVADLEIQKDCD
jgi:hypothetical protein